MRTHLIAILIETSSNYGRQLIQGIQRFVRESESQKWVMVIEERDLGDTPSWFKDWQGHGVISRNTTDHLVKDLRKRGLPFVDLTDRTERNDVPMIRSDDVMIGRLAAEHLGQSFVNHFAFCGFEGEAWSDRRKSGFVDSIKASTKTAVEPFQFESSWFKETARDWAIEKQRLTEWISQLPKPIGVMACNDVRAKQIIDCCYEASIPVPESVSVVGVDNDELLCEFSHVPMSSVAPNAVEVGYKAAETLSRFINSHSANWENRTVIVPPTEVVVRRSSDVVAIGDEELSDALKYIRANASSGIGVGELVKRMELSRSTLERKFRKFLGRSPQQEIRRVRLQHVCTLLKSSGLSIEKVAKNSGFSNAEYLHVIFRKQFDMTPGEYRRIHSHRVT